LGLALDKNTATCEKLLENKDILSPFLIFHGEQGSGKLLAAQNFTATLLNVSLEKLKNDPLHNFRYINFDDAEIKIEILPTIRDFLEHRNDQYKVLIIDNADHLNLHASNSLLKLFEHHYHKTFIILIVHNLHKFPKTLRSRFFEIAFESEIKHDELNEYTQGNQRLLTWVLNNGGLSLIHQIKHLLLSSQTTAEHENFIQKYKKDYKNVLMLMRITLYLEKNAKAFAHLNKFILRSDNTHIPMEDYIYMGFLLSR